ncbi:MAG: ABC transporter ATP-binding protein [Verrucomicrobiales bacterium]|nr:ABC transporter ATP-binding protein [Verrucomicrobiales bacterium]
MARIRLDCVRKTFRERRRGEVAAVAGVSLEVAEGEYLAVLGPSGSGKTTLLRLIAGLDRPSAGRVFIDDRDCTEEPPEAREVGLVFQGGALFPHLDVFENLALPLRLRRTPRAELERRVDEMSAWLGLDRLQRRRPGELSGGERQRVALGRALIRHPSVLLLDEPLAALDGPMRRQLRRDLLGLHRQLRLTVIHVTHDQGEAFGLGQRLAVLREGELQQVGPPRELYERPANVFVARFLGNMPMNLIPGRLCLEEGSTVFAAGDGGPGTLSLRLPEEIARRLGGPGRGAVTLGARPEDLELAEAVETTTLPGVRAEVEEWEETAGGEVWVHLRLGVHRLVARVGSGLDLKAGDGMLVRLPLGRVHWFDGETGKTLRGQALGGTTR